MELVWEHEKTVRKVREYQCMALSHAGRPCGRKFKRAWNLKRHLVTQHPAAQKSDGSTFVNTNMVAEENHTQALSRLPKTQPAPCSAVRSTVPPPGGRATMPMGAAPTLFLAGRLRFDEALPAYDVKTSKKHPRQMRALGWLTQKGKDDFESYIGTLMGSWGLLPSHGGVCIPWPQDWAALRPERIAETLNCDNYPLGSAYRAEYTYDDHTTTIARAAAWFLDGEWPRSGVQLDNFIECGPFRRTDASHRCHQGLCVTPSHIVYEPGWINQHRHVCQERAIFLRRERREVPPECDQHDPPCLLQHASLSVLEACMIACWVRRRCFRTTPTAAPTRPRLHPYPTFETQLPLQFTQLGRSAVLFDPQHRAAAGAAGLPGRRPELICGLCARLKSYYRVIGLWTHLVRKHQDRSEEDRLGEIRRVARLWREHLENAGRIGGGCDAATWAKLEQVEKDGLSWAVVEQWGLR